MSSSKTLHDSSSDSIPLRLQIFSWYSSRSNLVGTNLRYEYSLSLDYSTVSAWPCPPFRPSHPYVCRVLQPNFQIRDVLGFPQSRFAESLCRNLKFHKVRSWWEILVDFRTDFKVCGIWTVRKLFPQTKVCGIPKTWKYQVCGIFQGALENTTTSEKWRKVQLLPKNS